jgi:hypothetical protein
LNRGSIPLPRVSAGVAVDELCDFAGQYLGLFVDHAVAAVADAEEPGFCSRRGDFKTVGWNRDTIP